jgi:hypothetical protein
MITSAAMSNAVFAVCEATNCLEENLAQLAETSECGHCLCCALPVYLASLPMGACVSVILRSLGP